jgi:hypothetical protein
VVAQLLQGRGLEPVGFIHDEQFNERGDAPGLAVNADQLLDSRSFRTATGALDPGSPDFTARVCAAARDAAEADPRFRGSAHAGQTPGQGPGTAAQPRQWTLANVAAARTPQEVVDAGEAGLLRDLGYAPRRKRR